MKRTIVEGFAVAALVAIVNLLGGCANLDYSVIDKYIASAFEYLEQEVGATNATPPVVAATGAWPKACAEINAAMVTPIFVYSDAAQTLAQAKALADTKKYNAVAGLVDLQAGRPYIFAGRTPTRLAPEARRRMELTLGAGLTPLVIVRNDWAVRTKASSIPSLGGKAAPVNGSEFYAAAMLEAEKQFLDSFRDLWPFIHIQLNIEPNHKDSGQFAVALAKHLRGEGFVNKLIINPYDAAVAAHEGLRQQFAQYGVMWARSWHKETPPPDPAWNTDGNTAINSGNAKAWLSRLDASGKEWIMWSKELANSEKGIPSGYLVDSTAPPASNDGLPPSEAGDNNTFLWKPVSESDKKCVVLFPAWLGIASKKSPGKITVNGSASENTSYFNETNGNRPTYRLKRAGAAYGAGVRVELHHANGQTYSWTVPQGGKRYEVKSNP